MKLSGIEMSLEKAARFLEVRDCDLFPVPSIDFIVRVGKIPREEREEGFWIPVWRISRQYDAGQVRAILRMLKKRLDRFGIAFENEDNYLILSEEPLDEKCANEILGNL